MREPPTYPPITWKKHCITLGIYFAIFIFSLALQSLLADYAPSPLFLIQFWQTMILGLTLAGDAIILTAIFPFISKKPEVYFTVAIGLPVLAAIFLMYLISINQ